MPLSLRENIYRSRKLPVNEDLIIRRARLLSPKDRDLVLAVLVRGQSACSLGRLMGVDDRIIRKRVLRLARRMASRLFTSVMKALPYLTEPDAELARLRFCQGVTTAELSARMKIRPHLLRRKLDQLSAQIAVLCRMQSPSLQIDRESLSRYVK